MSQVGVALVSAGSALTGATIGGLFSLLKGRQEARERQADRDEQRRQRRLDSRRTTYVAFLRELSNTQDEYNKLHEFRLPASEEDWQVAATDALSARERLFQAWVEVGMVGPAVMAAQAERVVSQATTLLEEYVDAYEEHKGSSEEACLYDLVPGMSRVVNRLNVQRDRFLGAARVQLDGEVNEVPAEVLRQYIGSLGDFDAR
ncbi:hypothetical protein ABZS93_16185 [Streptomyces sp900116325]|uniref:hypothetical protein n=1 Tax=Streptomyces sp. 900116325 TaxID=3154295 RepID=UPI0033A6903A